MHLRLIKPAEVMEETNRFVLSLQPSALVREVE